MIKQIIDRLTTDIKRLQTRLENLLTEDKLATAEDIEEGIWFDEFLDEYSDGDEYHWLFTQYRVLKEQLDSITGTYTFRRDANNIKDIEKYLSADYIKEMQEALATDGTTWNWETKEGFENWLKQFHKDGREQGYSNLNYRASMNYPIYRTVISAYYSDMLRVFHSMDEYMSINDITVKILDIIKND